MMIATWRSQQYTSNRVCTPDEPLCTRVSFFFCVWISKV